MRLANVRSALRRFGDFMGACDGSEYAAMTQATADSRWMQAEIQRLNQENRRLASALACGSSEAGEEAPCSCGGHRAVAARLTR